MCECAHTCVCARTCMCVHACAHVCVRVYVCVCALMCMHCVRVCSCGSQRTPLDLTHGREGREFQVSASVVVALSYVVPQELRGKNTEDKTTKTWMLGLKHGSLGLLGAHLTDRAAWPACILRGFVVVLFG